jgi:hypothetical protein
MHVLQTVYLWFRQYCETTDQTYWEATLPVHSSPVQTLNGTLCAAPILAYTQPEERFIVDSNVGIGVLSQVQNGQERVIAYYSKALNKAERTYCITRRELLAIVRTLEHFHKQVYDKSSTSAGI